MENNYWSSIYEPSIYNFEETFTPSERQPVSPSCFCFPPISELVAPSRFSDGPHTYHDDT